MYHALIELSDKAYTPEAFAYSKFLIGRGFSVNLTSETVNRSDYDLGIKFLGFHPIWKNKNHGRCRFEIHEYHSLSTPPYSAIKDLVKSIFNSRPDGRIFLSNDVKSKLRLLSATPFIFRGMGVDREFFTATERTKEYHLVYSGSTSGRPGLIEEILRLSKLGFKILIIGSVNRQFVSSVTSHKNIEIAGRVNRNELPGLYKKCIAGINYTPNIYPFNIQDSTKTLEYCASGIGVVSNRYKWAEDFASTRNAKFLWLDQISTETQLETFNFVPPDVSDLEWEKLLESVKFLEFCLNGINRINRGVPA